MAKKPHLILSALLLQFVNGCPQALQAKITGGQAPFRLHSYASGVGTGCPLSVGHLCQYSILSRYTMKKGPGIPARSFFACRDFNSESDCGFRPINMLNPYEFQLFGGRCDFITHVQNDPTQSEITTQLIDLKSI